MTFEEFLIQAGLYTVIGADDVKQYLKEGYTISFFTKSYNPYSESPPTVTLDEILRSESVQTIEFESSTGFCTNYPPRAADFHNVSQTYIPTHIDQLTFPSSIGWSGGGDIVSYFSTFP